MPSPPPPPPPAPAPPPPPPPKDEVVEGVQKLIREMRLSRPPRQLPPPAPPAPPDPVAPRPRIEYPSSIPPPATWTWEAALGLLVLLIPVAAVVGGLGYLCRGPISDVFAGVYMPGFFLLLAAFLICCLIFR